MQIDRGAIYVALIGGALALANSFYQGLENRTLERQKHEQSLDLERQKHDQSLEAERVRSAAAQDLEERKARQQLSLRQLEQRYEVVARAAQNAGIEQSAGNLRFLLDAGILTDPDGKIRAALDTGQVPVFSSSATPTPSRNPLEERRNAPRSLQNSESSSTRNFILRNGVLFVDGNPLDGLPAESVGASFPAPPRYVIVRCTITPNSSAVERLIADPQRSLQASYHIVIERNGAVRQLVPLDIIAWHSGRGAWRGTDRLNQHALGVGIVTSGKLTKNGENTWIDSMGRQISNDDVVIIDGAGWHAYTDSQIASIREILGVLKKFIPSLEESVGADQIDPDRRNCPGPNFPSDLRGRL